MPKKLEPSIKKEIINMYNAGKTPKFISEKFGIYSNSVNRIIRNSGGSANQAKKETPQEQINIIIEQYNNGISSEDIAKKLELDGSTICRILKRNGVALRPATKNKRKYKIDENYFEKIDSQEKAYFLGVLFSDGNVSKDKNDIKIALKINDENILKKLSKLVYGFENISYEDGECLTAVLRMTCQKMKIDLITLGCVPAKTFLIRYPKIEPQYNSHFIRGYFDGDGCISIKKDERGCFDISSNINFINDIAEVIKKEINEELGIYIHKDKINSAFLQTTDRDKLRKLFDFLYQDATIYMERKYDKFVKYLNIIDAKENKLENDDLINYWFNYFRANNFPYPKYDNKVLLDDWNKLCQLNTSSLEKDKIFHSYIPTGLKLFKHYSPHFFDVRSNNKPSLTEAFSNDETLIKTIKNRIEQNYQLSNNMLIQGLRNGFFAFHSSIFYPYIAKYLYEKYCDDNDIVYDYSMGFGQRMLAALSLNKNLKYIGCDPYKKNIDAANNMVEFLRKNNCIKNDNSVELINAGSENYIGNEKVKLAFSSPPYYNKEIYCDEETQAYKMNYTDFIDKYWNKTCSNISNMLKNDGYFILNMAEKNKDNNLLNDMLNVCFNYGFVEMDRYYIKLSRNNKYMNKEKIKFEPIVVMKKK